MEANTAVPTEKRARDPVVVAPGSTVPPGNPEAVDEVPSLQAILVYEEEAEAEDEATARRRRT